MKPDPTHYTRLPPDSPSTTTTTVNYIILQPYHHPTRHLFRRYLLPLSLFLLLTFSLFLLFPTNPHLHLSRLHLHHLHLNTSHHLSLSLSISLTLNVRNPNFFSLTYDSLNVSISYRGNQLGFVKSNGGKIKARASSYVDATLVVDGFEVVHDLFYLIQDVANGDVPFDTVSDVTGLLGLFFVDVPIQAKVSCEVDVNPKDQTIVQQNCYPE